MIATRIINKILEKIGSDTQSQATQLALMNLIGADVTKNQPKLNDQQAWYQDKGVYQGQELTDPTSKLFSLAQDRLHEQLTDLQYRR